MNRLIIIVLMLFMPILAFPQFRSVAMVFQLETTEATVPTLFYMFQDSVIYDLGKGKEGVYNECIPAKMVNTDAAFVIQVDNKWEKIATVGQLEEQGVYSDGTITLTLLEITRIPRDAPDDPREYKTPPNPYHRALLSDDGLPFTDSTRSSHQLLLVASSAEDSLYCSSLLPKRAIDGTFYMDNDFIRYPKASCIDKTDDCLKTQFREFYLQCEADEVIKLGINEMTLIVDEKGVVRGLFCFVEKEKVAYGKNFATKIFNHFKNERFHPAKDINMGKAVPDLIELSTHFCKTFYYDTVKESSNQLNRFILESVCHFVEEHNAFAKQINSDTIRYIWSNGLPYDFPYDSLYLKKLSISSIENNPKTTKKALKRFVKTMRVSYTLENNVIDIVISKCRIKRPRKGRVQIEVDGESVSHYYYEYNCETNNWKRVIKCVYSDVITHSFVCLQNDSISVYYNSPNLDEPSCFYGTYRCSNDTLSLSNNLLKDGIKPNEYLFVLDSTHRTLSIIPYPSRINETTPHNLSNNEIMMLGRRFKNASCFEELKKVL